MTVRWIEVWSLFPGYGRLDLAVEHYSDVETNWFSEGNEPVARDLSHHWPDAPSLEDIAAINCATVPPVGHYRSWVTLPEAASMLPYLAGDGIISRAGPISLLRLDACLTKHAQAATASVTEFIRVARAVYDRDWSAIAYG